MEVRGKMGVMKRIQCQMEVVEGGCTGKVGAVKVHWGF